MEDFHFLRPLWLFALVPAALLVLWAWWRQRGGGHWSRAVDAELLPWLLTATPAGGDRRSACLVLLAGWVLAVIALAGPAWERLPSPLERKLDLQIVLFDLSASMYAQDVRPSRLERARHKLRDLLTRRQEGQTALIVYAGDAFVVTPFTDDQATILNQVQALDPQLLPASGSRLRKALREAESLLQETGGSPVRLLLITDEVRAQEQEAVDRWLQRHGLRMDVLAVGTPAGAPVPLPGGGFARDAQGELVIPKLDVDALRALAVSTGGQVQVLRADDADIEALLAAETGWGGTDTSKEERMADTWRDAGPWLILLLLPLAASGFRRGWLGLPLCALLLQPPDAHALEWSDLWRTPDQRAAAAFDTQSYEDAAETFTDPEWRAAALYRAGRPDEAAAALQALDHPRAHYNRGNALAAANRLEEALSAYDRALQLDPDYPDARENRSRVEDLLKQQQEQAGTGMPQSDASGQQHEDSREHGATPPETGPGDPSPETGGAARTGPEASPLPETKDTPPPAQQQESGQTTAPRAEPGPGEPGANAAESLAETGDAEATPRPPEADPEAQQAMEQWLRRIPDDPAALLRRKFLWQYQQRRAEPPEAGEPYW